MTTGSVGGGGAIFPALGFGFGSGFGGGLVPTRMILYSPR